MSDYFSKLSELGARPEPASVIEPLAAARGTDSPHAGQFDQEDLMDRLMGDAELAAEVARMFVDSMPQDLLALAHAIHHSDPAAIEFAAHRIKGAAANLGATAVRNTASKLEQFGKEGNVEAASVAMPELEAMFRSLKPAIERFCDREEQ